MPDIARATPFGLILRCPCSTCPCRGGITPDPPAVGVIDSPMLYLSNNPPNLLLFLFSQSPPVAVRRIDNRKLERLVGHFAHDVRAVRKDTSRVADMLDPHAILLYRSISAINHARGCFMVRCFNAISSATAAAPISAVNRASNFTASPSLPWQTRHWTRRLFRFQRVP